MAKRKKHRSWEAQELGEINRYWQRPKWGTRELDRQLSVKRTSGTRTVKRSSSRS